MLATNRNGHQTGASFDQPSLLAGLLWDEHGRRMSPTHTQKGPSRRYRYYASRNDGPVRDQPIIRVPAADIEAVVVGRLCVLLKDEGALMDALSSHNLDAVALNAMLFACRQQAVRLDGAIPTEIRTVVAHHISRIEMQCERVVIHVSPASLVEGFVSAAGRPRRAEADFALTVIARFGRTGKEVRLVVAPSTSTPVNATGSNRDPALIKLIVKAHSARAALMATPQDSVEDIARAQGYDRDYFGVLLRLSWLAPDIMQSILEGRHPPALNRQSLARMGGLSLCWAEQSKPAL
jgi:site-specific DNA recombinase